jgi:hypothetical protein
MLRKAAGRMDMMTGVGGWEGAPGTADAFFPWQGNQK